MNKLAQADTWQSLIWIILIILGLLIGIYIIYQVFTSGAFDPARLG
jgi:hypothetical protein